MIITGTILLGWEPDTLSVEQRAWIAARAPQARLVVTTDRQQMAAELPQVQVAAGQVPYDLLPQAPQLVWFAQFGAGVDWLLRHPALRDKPFVLTNGSGIHAVPISEHILGMMLALAHQLDASWRSQQRHEWSRQHGQDVWELCGQTMVLVGVGAIGERTALLAQALGMRVLGVRRNPERQAAGVERLVGPDRLRDLLPEADWLVLTVPLTPETHHQIGAPELALLKSSAVLINIGRGGTVDEQALIEALHRGALAGAGLDVFEQEPLPASSPLWDMPNVLITPHYAGATPKRSERAWELLSDNLERLIDNRPLRNVVDKTLGY
jgi:phosphoglycerate dehydrogenase-like enzyme